VNAVNVETTSTGDPTVVKVTVRTRSDPSTHEVTASRADLDRLTRPGEPVEQFVARCFEFLLAREPKEAILARFDIADISRYWPEFEEEITSEAGC
jgi:hypothetical protein